MQIELFPTEVRLRQIDPTKNMRRFYSLSMQPTLFGEWAVVRHWGRLGTKGRTQLELHAGAGEALSAYGGNNATESQSRLCLRPIAKSN